MAAVVYTICALLSTACAILLLRGYSRTGFRLLFWSGLGFVGFVLNNALLLVDLATPETFDLSIIRTLPALLGMIVMIYGLITDSV